MVCAGNVYVRFWKYINSRLFYIIDCVHLTGGVGFYSCVCERDRGLLLFLEVSRNSTNGYMSIYAFSSLKNELDMESISSNLLMLFFYQDDLAVFRKQ